MKRSSNLLECVPNFSVGPDPVILREIENAFHSVAGAHVLDIHTDASHNRSVFTVVGAPLPLMESTFEAVRTAMQHIELRQHRGQHPRIGAVDVIPFVAIPPTPSTVAIATAREFAECIANALDLPVYLYEQATVGATPKILPTVRRGGFEWLRSALQEGLAASPDFGPRLVHPSAGATAVGARSFLVAFNVNVETHNVEIAKEIARNIRASNGGHPGVRAIGLSVNGRAQVSMNLFDLAAVNILRAYDLVATQAANLGTEIHSSEIVGLAPRAALAGVSPDAIKLAGDVEDYVLETRIERTITR